MDEVISHLLGPSFASSAVRGPEATVREVVFIAAPIEGVHMHSSISCFGNSNGNAPSPSTRKRSGASYLSFEGSPPSKIYYGILKVRATVFKLLALTIANNTSLLIQRFSDEKINLD